MLLAAVPALAGCSAAASAGAHPVAVNFSLPALGHQNKRVSLAAYAGRPVIVNFCSSWSPPCVQETQLLGHFYRFYHYKVTIIGVDSHDQASAELSLLRRSDATYPVAADPTESAAFAYHVLGFPSTFFLNAGHQIVKTDLGWLSWKKLVTGVQAMGQRLPAAENSSS